MWKVKLSCFFQSDKRVGIEQDYAEAEGFNSRLVEQIFVKISLNFLDIRVYLCHPHAHDI